MHVDGINKCPYKHKLFKLLRTMEDLLLSFHTAKLHVSHGAVGEGNEKQKRYTDHGMSADNAGTVQVDAANHLARLPGLHPSTKGTGTTDGKCEEVQHIP